MKKNKKIFILLSIIILSTLIIFFVYNCNNRSAPVYQRGDYSMALSLLDSGDSLKAVNTMEFMDEEDKVVIDYVEFSDASNDVVGYSLINAKTGYVHEFGRGQLLLDLLKPYELTYEDIRNAKVYYAGPFSIFVEMSDGKILELMPTSCQFPSVITRENMLKAFEYKIDFNRKPEVNKEIRGKKKDRSFLNSFVPYTTKYFENLKIKDRDGRFVYPRGHCAPTAATNIMIYANENRMTNFSKEYKASDIFAMFYIAMDTNGGYSGSDYDGTSRSNIAPAYREVTADMDINPAKIYLKVNPSRNDMMQAIDDGTLLHVSVDEIDYRNMSHAIAAVDRIGSYFWIADGWREELRTLDYGDMRVVQMVEIKF